MYFTLSPFFYYLANQPSIESYIAIESNGESPYLMPYGKLVSIVEQYVKINSHGVDDSKKLDYIHYICDKLSNRQRD